MMALIKVKGTLVRHSRKVRRISGGLGTQTGGLYPFGLELWLELCRFFVSRFSKYIGRTLSGKLSIC